MRVLLIGGGGREHAIAWKLKQSPLLTELLCAPGNAGIAEIAKVFPDVKATDIDAVIDLARREKIDFVVIGPDDPLAIGIVDRLEQEGFPTFGPTAAAARFEASKAYSKAMMKKYGIPTAAHETFDDLAKAEEYILKQGAPIVVKCDGLALGKGVIIARTVEEALDGVRSMMRDKQFGDSGARVVIEECMEGPEVTQLVFMDGEHCSLMPSSLDHKRALDNDEGLNTGGMGAVSPNPYYSDDMRGRTMQSIVLPTIAMMKKEGVPFKGILYVGLMLTSAGPKAIEYNARFGDPETQVVLPLLESDLLEIMLACRNGTLDGVDIRWSGKCCAGVVMASGGYPGIYQTGYPIQGIESAKEKGSLVFHAGTRNGEQNGSVVTAGGRVLAVSAIADSQSEAVERAYQAAACISFRDLHMRMDIGRPSHPPAGV